MPRGGARPNSGTKPGSKRGPYLTTKAKGKAEAVDISEYSVRMKAIIETELFHDDDKRRLRMFEQLKEYFFRKQPIAMEGGPANGFQLVLTMPPKAIDPNQLPDQKAEVIEDAPNAIPIEATSAASPLTVSEEGASSREDV
jgi:hypothetical protein